MRLWLLISSTLLLSLLSFSGCGSSSDTSATRSYASVTGYLYIDADNTRASNTALLLSNSDTPPEGYVAFANAKVDVRNIYKEVVGSSNTSSTGSFEIKDLPSGYLNVEIRLDASSVDADYTAAITAVPAITVALGREYAISRNDAITLALTGVDPSARAFASMQPLPKGTTLAPQAATEERAPDVIHVLQNDAYLVFIDLKPGARFAHKVIYRLVDATSGEVTTLSEFWPPLVNDALLWGSEFDYVLFDGIDFETYTYNLDDLSEAFDAVLSDEVIQWPEDEDSLTAVALRSNTDLLNQTNSSPIHRFHNTTPDSLFLINVVGDGRGDFLADFIHMQDFFYFANVPQSNWELVNFTKTTRAVNSYVPQNTNPYSLALNNTNAKINARLANDLHSNLVVYISTHGVKKVGTELKGAGLFTATYKDTDGNNNNDTEYWSASDLNLLSTKACTVTVILDMCFADTIAQEIKSIFEAHPKDERPLLYIFAASHAEETSDGVGVYEAYRYRKSGKTGIRQTSGGRFTNTMLATSTISNGNFNGPTINADASLQGHDSNVILSSPRGYRIDGDPKWCHDEEEHTSSSSSTGISISSSSESSSSSLSDASSSSSSSEGISISDIKLDLGYFHPDPNPGYSYLEWELDFQASSGGVRVVTKINGETVYEGVNYAEWGGIEKIYAFGQYEVIVEIYDVLDSARPIETITKTILVDSTNRPL